MNEIKIGNVLSVFDGISCGQIALNRCGIQYENYYSSEVDKYAIKITQANYPNTIQVGDIVNLKASDLPKIDLMIGGFPCQAFSIAGNRGGFDDPRGKLFFELLRLKNELNPRYFMFENNESMDKKIQAYISRLLGVVPLHINSALVSAQNRERIYWTNINLSTYGLFNEPYSAIHQPKDRGIILKDILESNVDEKYYISEKALARMINTKNNSAQLSIENGTTLIEQTLSLEHFNKTKASTLLSSGGSPDYRDTFVIDVEGHLKRNQNKSGCFTAGGNTGGNHSDMDLIVQRMDINGDIKEGDKSAAVMSSHGLGKYSDLIVCHNMLPRSGDPNIGGTGHLTLEDGKSYCLQTSNINAIERKVIQLNNSTESGESQLYQQNRIYDEDGIHPTCNTDNNGMIKTKTQIRRLTEIECERLQTIPDNYTNHVSSTQRYKAIGNGWTIDVICHIFSFIK